MKNLAPDINDIILIFKQSIAEYFALNLAQYTCSTLANMLALDYTSRLNNIITIEDHISKCVDKLTHLLGQKVIVEDNFSSVVTLFAVAISSQPISYQNKNNALKQPQSEDAVLEFIAQSCCDGSDSACDKQKIKDIIRNLLHNKGNKILDFINREPILFTSIAGGAIAKHKTQDAINKNVQAQLNKILNKTIDFNNKKNALVQKITKITSIACVLVGIAVSSLASGIVMPIVIMPVTVLSMQFTTKLCKRVAEVITAFDTSIKQNLEDINEIKLGLLKNNSQAMTFKIQHDTRAKETEQMISLVTQQKDEHGLKAISETLAEHKSVNHVGIEKHFSPEVTKNKENTKGRSAT